MKKDISPRNLPFLMEPDEDSIDGELFLLENPIFHQSAFHPNKTTDTICIICTKGSMKLKTNVREYEVVAPSFFTIISGQIWQCQELSKDFRCYLVILTDRYTEKLFSDLNERYPLKHSVLDQPLTQINQPELEPMIDIFNAIRTTIRTKDNPFRSVIIKHQILTFFYQTSYQYHKAAQENTKSKFDVLFDNFLSLIRQHYKTHRKVEFYAGELFITAKHLSKVLKEKTSKTATEWINEQVIQEAKLLLKSTNKTIQQISDEFNFPSQSFFGKYFKQQVKLSPKDYRNSIK